MSWLWPLIASKQDDFILNVLAGVPFLIIDLVILTLLLPNAIRWWEELDWVGSRRAAMTHILDRYADAHWKMTLVVPWDTEDRAREFATRHKLLSEIAINGSKVVREIASRMDTEIQTALPILGPRISKELLDFHYSWRSFVDWSADRIESVIEVEKLQRNGDLHGWSLNLAKHWPDSERACLDLSVHFWRLCNRFVWRESETSRLGQLPSLRSLLANLKLLDAILAAPPIVVGRFSDGFVDDPVSMYFARLKVEKRVRRYGENWLKALMRRAGHVLEEARKNVRRRRKPRAIDQDD